jgi:spore coat polysaccharide biosynthesis protein SpsF
MSAQRTIIIIQARMTSTRLPGKVMLPLMGRPMLQHIVERSKAIIGVDDVVIATSDDHSDDPLAHLCEEQRWACFRGSLGDVLDRYYKAALTYEAKSIGRVTSDCPFLCFNEASRLLAHHQTAEADYSHNLTVWGSGMPLGTGTEFFTMDALRRSWELGHEPKHREHVDEWVGDNRSQLRFETLAAPSELRRPDLRLTVDKPEDFELTSKIYESLYSEGRLFSVHDVIAFLDLHPELTEINAHIEQKAVR